MSRASSLPLHRYEVRREFQTPPSATASFDLHPDGERVAMAPVTEATAGRTHVTLVFNFFDELRRLAPVK